MTPRELVQQALTHHRAGDLAQAEALYKQALAIDPNFPDALHFLGTLSHQCGQDDLAIDLLKRAIQFKPSPRSYNNLGEVFRGLDRIDEAANCFNAAIRMVPNYAEAHQNLGVVLAQQMQLDAAIEEYDRAILYQADNAEAHVNRALVWLAQGNFDKGLREYEWRQKRPDYHRPFTQPRWTGSPLAGRTLLLWSEQGFGDTIQFARFIPSITNDGGSILFESQPELRPLFEGAFDVQLVSAGHDLPPFDIQCPLLSLALILGTTPKSIPAKTPYILPPAGRIDRWRERIHSPSDSMKIGLAWASNALNPTAKRRSCRLTDFAPLATLPHIEFFSLQKGPAAEETRTPPPGMHITDLSADLGDFADTAAAINQLDLVITVDTAVAHLAGAMGKAVWVLLPVASDWRWLLDRTDSPWYPTAHLFRQTTPGDWASVIQNVLTELS